MPDETFRHLLLLGGEERAMNTLRFLKAEQTKAKVTNEQLEYIKMMYQNISYNFGKKIKSLEGKTNISSILKTQYLHEYQKELADEISKINQKIGSNIKNGMEQVAQAVVDNEVDRALSYGLLGISGKFSNIPTDVVETIVSGQLYQSDWTLSKAIWGMNEKVHKDCQNIVAMGIAANKGVYDVAKALEQYVDPSAKKDYKWSRDYPGSNKVVDYNASRLARTMMSHAYQESFERATEHDPFVQGYKWNTGHNTRVCPYCMAMSTEDKFGLGQGIYPKDKVPLDHPNGQCFLTIVQNKSSEQVADDIANWYNGAGDAEMNAKIDKFAESLGYKLTSSKPIPIEPKEAIKPKETKLKQYTQKQIENASKFIKEFDMDGIAKQKYMDTILGTSREFQNCFVDAMKKKVKHWECVDDGSYYQSAFHSISLTKSDIKVWGYKTNPQSKQVLFHEIGHAIDDLAPGNVAKYSKSSKYGFKEAMLQDMKEMNQKCKTDKEYVKKLQHVVDDDASAGVQDAISAMHCKGIGLKDVNENITIWYHHSTEYYERKDAKIEAASELFANMCGAQVDDKAVAYMEEYFPNAYKVFWNIINDIGA